MGQQGDQPRKNPELPDDDETPEILAADSTNRTDTKAETQTQTTGDRNGDAAAGKTNDIGRGGGDGNGNGNGTDAAPEELKDFQKLLQTAIAKLTERDVSKDGPVQNVHGGKQVVWQHDEFGSVKTTKGKSSVDTEFEKAGPNGLKSFRQNADGTGRAEYKDRADGLAVEEFSRTNGSFIHTRNFENGNREVRTIRGGDIKLSGTDERGEFQGKERKLGDGSSIKQKTYKDGTTLSSFEGKVGSASTNQVITDVLIDRVSTLETRREAMIALEQLRDSQTEPARAQHTQELDKFKALNSGMNALAPNPVAPAEDLKYLNAISKGPPVNPTAAEMVTALGGEAAVAKLQQSLTSPDAAMRAEALAEVQAKLRPVVDGKMNDLRIEKILRAFSADGRTDSARLATVQNALRNEVSSGNQGAGDALRWANVAKPLAALAEIKPGSPTQAQDAQKAFEEIAKQARAGNPHAHKTLTALMAANRGVGEQVDGLQNKPGDKLSIKVPDLSALSPETRRTIQTKAAFYLMNETAHNGGKMNRADGVAVEAAITDARKSGDKPAENLYRRILDHSFTGRDSALATEIETRLASGYEDLIPLETADGIEYRNAKSEVSERLNSSTGDREFLEEGRRKSAIDGDGTKRRYDADERLMAARTPDGRTRDFQYDLDGKLAKISDSDGTSFSRDKDGNWIRKDKAGLDTKIAKENFSGPDEKGNIKYTLEVKNAKGLPLEAKTEINENLDGSSVESRNGKVTRATDVTGHAREFGYDKTSGKLNYLKTPQGDEWRAENPEATKWSKENPDKTKTFFDGTMNVDGAGKLTETFLGEKNGDHRVYDTRGGFAYFGADGQVRGMGTARGEAFIASRNKDNPNEIERLATNDGMVLTRQGKDPTSGLDTWKATKGGQDAGTVTASFEVKEGVTVKTTADSITTYDRSGRTVTVDKNNPARVTSEIKPDGTRIDYSFKNGAADGRVEYNPDKSVTTYDRENSITKVRAASGQERNFEHTFGADGRRFVSRISESNGTEWRSLDGKTYSRTGANDSVTGVLRISQDGSYSIDTARGTTFTRSADNIVSVVDRTNPVEANREIAKVFEDGSRITRTSNGQLATTVDSLGNKTELTANADGTITRIKESNGDIWKSEDGKTFTKESDPTQKREEAFDRADGTRKTIERNADGSVKSESTRRLDGSVTVKDAQNRVTSVADQTGRKTQFKYSDANAKEPNQVISTVGGDSCTYDTVDGGKTWTTNGASPKPMTISVGSDGKIFLKEGGKETTIKTDGWSAVKDNGQTRLETTLRDKTTVVKNDHGLVSEVRMANGEKRTFDYDSHGQMTAMTDVRGEKWTRGDTNANVWKNAKGEERRFTADVSENGAYREVYPDKSSKIFKTDGAEISANAKGAITEILEAEHPTSQSVRNNVEDLKAAFATGNGARVRQILEGAGNAERRAISAEFQGNNQNLETEIRKFVKGDQLEPSIKALTADRPAPRMRHAFTIDDKNNVVGITEGLQGQEVSLKLVEAPLLPGDMAKWQGPDGKVAEAKFQVMAEGSILRESMVAGKKEGSLRTTDGAEKRFSDGKSTGTTTADGITYDQVKLNLRSSTGAVETCELLAIRQPDGQTQFMDTAKKPPELVAHRNSDGTTFILDNKTVTQVQDRDGKVIADFNYKDGKLSSYKIGTNPEQPVEPGTAKAFVDFKKADEKGNFKAEIMMQTEAIYKTQSRVQLDGTKIVTDNGKNGRRVYNAKNQLIETFNGETKVGYRFERHDDGRLKSTQRMGANGALEQKYTHQSGNRWVGENGKVWEGNAWEDGNGNYFERPTNIYGEHRNFYIHRGEETANGTNLAKPADEIEYAFNGGTGWTTSSDKENVRNHLRGKNQLELQVLNQVWWDKYGRNYGWDLRGEFRDESSGAELHEFNRLLDGTKGPDYAGDIMTDIKEAGEWGSLLRSSGRSQSEIEKSIRDTLRVRTFSEIRELEQAVQQRQRNVGEPVQTLEQMTVTNKNLTEKTRKADAIYIKGSDFRTDGDVLNLADLALNAKDLDMFHEVWAGASDTARERFFTHDGVDRIKKAFGPIWPFSEGTNLSRALDYAKFGERSLATKVKENTSFWGDNESEIEKAARELPPKERELYLRGRALTLGLASESQNLKDPANMPPDEKAMWERGKKLVEGSADDIAVRPAPTEVAADKREDYLRGHEIDRVRPKVNRDNLKPDDKRALDVYEQLSKPARDDQKAIDFYVSHRKASNFDAEARDYYTKARDRFAAAGNASEQLSWDALAAYKGDNMLSGLFKHKGFWSDSSTHDVMKTIEGMSSTDWERLRHAKIEFDKTGQSIEDAVKTSEVGGNYYVDTMRLLRTFANGDVGAQTSLKPHERSEMRRTIDLINKKLSSDAFSSPEQKAQIALGKTLNDSVFDPTKLNKDQRAALQEFAKRGDPPDMTKMNEVDKARFIQGKELSAQINALALYLDNQRYEHGKALFAEGKILPDKMGQKEVEQMEVFRTISAAGTDPATLKPEHKALYEQGKDLAEKLGAVEFYKQKAYEAATKSGNRDLRSAIEDNLRWYDDKEDNIMDVIQKMSPEEVASWKAIGDKHGKDILERRQDWSKLPQQEREILQRLDGRLSGSEFAIAKGLISQAFDGKQPKMEMMDKLRRHASHWFGDRGEAVRDISDAFKHDPSIRDRLNHPRSAQELQRVFEVSTQLREDQRYLLDQAKGKGSGSLDAELKSQVDQINKDNPSLNLTVEELRQAYQFDPTFRKELMEARNTGDDSKYQTKLKELSARETTFATQFKSTARDALGSTDYQTYIEPLLKDGKLSLEKTQALNASIWGVDEQGSYKDAASVGAALSPEERQQYKESGRLNRAFMRLTPGEKRIAINAFMQGEFRPEDKLKSYMEGLGTSEDEIRQVLGEIRNRDTAKEALLKRLPKDTAITDAMVTDEVNNRIEHVKDEYKRKYGETLEADFRSDMSGQDLRDALRGIRREARDPLEAAFMARKVTAETYGLGTWFADNTFLGDGTTAELGDSYERMMGRMQEAGRDPDRVYTAQEARDDLERVDKAQDASIETQNFIVDTGVDALITAAAIIAAIPSAGGSLAALGANFAAKIPAGARVVASLSRAATVINRTKYGTNLAWAAAGGTTKLLAKHSTVSGHDLVGDGTSDFLDGAFNAFFNADVGKFAKKASSEVMEGVGKSLGRKAGSELTEAGIREGLTAGTAEALERAGGKVLREGADDTFKQLNKLADDAIKGLDPSRGLKNFADDLVSKNISKELREQVVKELQETIEKNFRTMVTQQQEKLTNMFLREVAWNMRQGFLGGTAGGLARLDFDAGLEANAQQLALGGLMGAGMGGTFTLGFKALGAGLHYANEGATYALQKAGLKKAPDMPASGAVRGAATNNGNGANGAPHTDGSPVTASHSDGSAAHDAAFVPGATRRPEQRPLPSDAARKGDGRPAREIPHGQSATDIDDSFFRVSEGNRELLGPGQNVYLDDGLVAGFGVGENANRVVAVGSKSEVKLSGDSVAAIHDGALVDLNGRASASLHGDSKGSFNDQSFGTLNDTSTASVSGRANVVANDNARVEVSGLFRDTDPTITLNGASQADIRASAVVNGNGPGTRISVGSGATDVELNLTNGRATIGDAQVTVRGSGEIQVSGKAPVTVDVPDGETMRVVIKSGETDVKLAHTSKGKIELVGPDGRSLNRELARAEAPPRQIDPFAGGPMGRENAVDLLKQGDISTVREFNMGQEPISVFQAVQRGADGVERPVIVRTGRPPGAELPEEVLQRFALEQKAYAASNAINGQPGLYPAATIREVEVNGLKVKAMVQEHAGQILADFRNSPQFRAMPDQQRLTFACSLEDAIAERHVMGDNDFHANNFVVSKNANGDYVVSNIDYGRGFDQRLLPDWGIGGVGREQTFNEFAGRALSPDAQARLKTFIDTLRADTPDGVAMRQRLQDSGLGDLDIKRMGKRAEVLLSNGFPPKDGYHTGATPMRTRPEADSPATTGDASGATSEGQPLKPPGRKPPADRDEIIELKLVVPEQYRSGMTDQELVQALDIPSAPTRLEIEKNRLPQPVVEKQKFEVAKSGIDTTPLPNETNYQHAARVSETIEKDALVYKFNKDGQTLDIIVDAEYAKQLDEVRQLRLVAEKPPHLTKTREEYNAILAAKQALKQHPLRDRVLPEDILQHMSDLPPLVKQLVLEPNPSIHDAWFSKDWKPNFVSAADANSSSGRVRFFPGTDSRSPETVSRIARHEWSHILEHAAPKARSKFDLAVKIEDKGFHIDGPDGYSTYNNNENWAVHFEEFLHKDSSHLVLLAREAPVRAITMAEALETALNKIPPDQITPKHIALKNRIEYVLDPNGTTIAGARNSINAALGSENPQRVVGAMAWLDMVSGAGAADKIKDIVMKSPDSEVGRVGVELISKRFEGRNYSPENSKRRLELLREIAHAESPAAGHALMKLKYADVDTATKLLDNGHITDLYKRGIMDDPRVLVAMSEIDHLEAAQRVQKTLADLADAPQLREKYLVALSENNMFTHIALKEMAKNPVEAYRESFERILGSQINKSNHEEVKRLIAVLDDADIIPLVRADAPPATKSGAGRGVDATGLRDSDAIPVGIRGADGFNPEAAVQRQFTDNLRTLVQDWEPLLNKVELMKRADFLAGQHRQNEASLRTVPDAEPHADVNRDLAAARAAEAEPMRKELQEKLTARAEQVQQSFNKILAEKGMPPTKLEVIGLQPGTGGGAAHFDPTTGTIKIDAATLAGARSPEELSNIISRAYADRSKDGAALIAEQKAISALIESRNTAERTGFALVYEGGGELTLKTLQKNDAAGQSLRATLFGDQAPPERLQALMLDFEKASLRDKIDTRIWTPEKSVEAKAMLKEIADRRAVEFNAKLPKEDTPGMRVFDEKNPENPFLDEIKTTDFANDPFGEKRMELSMKYSWAIPNREALGTIYDIAAKEGVVEVGAGNGYWAKQMRDMGIDVKAFDYRPVEAGSNQYHGTTGWSKVEEGDVTAGGKHPDRALLLSWPPPDEPMGAQALKNYADAGGKKLIFIGEQALPSAQPHEVVTGDKAFHEMLARDWVMVKAVDLPKMPNDNVGVTGDKMFVYVRKGSDLDPSVMARAKPSEVRGDTTPASQPNQPGSATDVGRKFQHSDNIDYQGHHGTVVESTDRGGMILFVPGAVKDASPTGIAPPQDLNSNPRYRQLRVVDLAGNERNTKYFQDTSTNTFFKVEEAGHVRMRFPAEEIVQAMPGDIKLRQATPEFLKRTTARRENEEMLTRVKDIPEKPPITFESLTRRLTAQKPEDVVTQKLKPEFQGLTREDIVKRFEGMSNSDYQKFKDMAYLPETKTTMAVYKLDTHPDLKIYIPQNKIELHEKIRELRVKAESGPHAERELAKLQLTQPKFKYELLPEDIIRHLDELPDGGQSIKRLTLSDKPNQDDVWSTFTHRDKQTSVFRSAATASGDHVTFYPEFARSGMPVDEVLKHEWSHILERTAFGPRSAFEEAIKLEKSSGTAFHHRHYATYNNNEDWAVHVGEVMLAKDVDSFHAMVNAVRDTDSSFKILIMAQGIRESMDAAAKNGVKFHGEIELRARLDYLDEKLKPYAQKRMIEVATGPKILDSEGDQIRADRLLAVLGTKETANKLFEHALQPGLTTAEIKDLLNSAKSVGDDLRIPENVLARMLDLGGEHEAIALSQIALHAVPNGDIVRRVEQSVLDGSLIKLMNEGKLNDGELILYNLMLNDQSTQIEALFKSVGEQLKDNPVMRSMLIASLAYEGDAPISRLAVRELAKLESLDEIAEEYLRRAISDHGHPIHEPESARELEVTKELLAKIDAKRSGS